MADQEYDLVEEIVGEIAKEFGYTREQVEVIRLEVKEQYNGRLLGAVERAMKRGRSDISRTETLARIGVPPGEWESVYDAIAMGFGVESHSTKRLQRITRDALMLGILIGIEFEEPGGLERTPAERAVMRRRQFGHQPTARPGRRDDQ